MAARDFPTIRERAKALFINLAISYAVFVTAAGQFLPTGGLESVWLMSALAFWLLTLLSAPWFLPPRDALANAVGAAAILVTTVINPAVGFAGLLEIIRWVAILYCATITLLAVAALFLHDDDPRSALGAFAFRLTGNFGKGEILYTPPALISVIGAYQQSLSTVAWLTVFWVLLIVVRPVERVLSALRQLKSDQTSLERDPSVGIIDRVDHPNIVRVRLAESAAWEPRTLHIAVMPDGNEKYVLALFKQVQGNDVMGTGLCVGEVAERRLLPRGSVCQSHDANMTTQFLENLSGTQGSELIGFTVENSTIAFLRFEVAASQDLSEGEVIFARVGTKDIFYQILDAETTEESFDQNPRGTHIVRAAQLGEYSVTQGFTKYPWLPAMNTPLFSAKNTVFNPQQRSDREFEIGTVPSTNIGVVANIDELVEYHTAILGVTGTGKTELALDLVREAHQKEIKVFCVDFTGDYRARLQDLHPIYPAPTGAQATDLEAKIFAVETGTYGASAEKAALKTTIQTLRTAIDAQIDSFLRDPGQNLAIFELAEIANTKASLRLTELYLSSIMSWARTNRRARQVMIVLEEAHTIVPETYGSGFDAETQNVVSRTGQIALQGRKYGVGLLVITQRTALVSKTILSQCNTFLTHSLIDQTSLNFLESVYSSQHTRLIPNLGRFEFLAFGKALRSERPILLKRPFVQGKKDASDALRRPLVAAPQREDRLIIPE